MAINSVHDGPALYWTCWICCAPGGYDHNTENAYAGDVSKLLLSDREFFHHKLHTASRETRRLLQLPTEQQMIKRRA